MCKVVLVGLIQKIEHGRVLRIGGGADASRWFVQHEVTSGLAHLQHFVVEHDVAEFTNVVQRVLDRQPIDLQPAGEQREAHVLATEAGEVAEEAVEAHWQIGVQRGWGMLRQVWRSLNL